MNMTKQIILGADLSFRYRKLNLAKQASNMSDKEEVLCFYNEWNKKITEEVCSSSYATELLYRDQCRLVKGSSERLDFIDILHKIVL